MPRSTARLLLILAFCLGCGSILTGATASERNEHVKAIRALVQMGFRLPAQRAIAAFDQAGYPDDGGWCAKALDYLYADTFRTSAPSAEAAKLEASYQQLKGEFEGNGSACPPAIATLVLGGSGSQAAIIRLVNDILRVLNPDLPPPLAPLTDEQKTALSRTVKSLIELAGREFEADSDKIKNSGEDEKIFDLNPTDPKFIAEAQKRTNERLAAVTKLYLARIALREVVSRGKLFGIDPKPAATFLHDLLSAHLSQLGNWDWEWGSYHPFLHAYVDFLQCEAIREGLASSKLSEADAEAAVETVTNENVASFPAGARHEVEVLELRAWLELLRFHLDMATPAEYAKGLQTFKDFLHHTKGHQEFSLASTDPAFGSLIGEIYLVAGRLAAAASDSATASATWAQVEAAHNALADNAKAWIVSLGPGVQTEGWGKPPLSMEPTQALDVARAYIQQALSTTAAQGRTYFMNAAIQLRNGVLGLDQYPDEFIDHGPILYLTYAYSLSKLGMPYHAAIVALEGLRAVKGHIPAHGNPWKTHDGHWTTSGKTISKLTSTAIAYAYALHNLTGNDATQNLFAEVARIGKDIDPSLVGPGLKWPLVLQKYNEGDYQGAIHDAESFAHEYPKWYFVAFRFITNARITWIEKLQADAKTDPSVKDRIDRVLAKLLKSTSSVAKVLTAQLANPKGLTKSDIADRRQALNTCKTATFLVSIKTRKFRPVLTQISDPALWKPRPGADLGRRLLHYLALAMYNDQQSVHAAVTANPADPAPVVESWPAYHAAIRTYRIWNRRYPDDSASTINDDKLMAIACSNYYNLTQSLLQTKPTDHVLAAAGMGSKRAFADFLEPTISDTTDPNTIYITAQTLWDIDQKARAARLFKIYSASLAHDAAVQAYRKDPAAVIDKFGAILDQRLELKKLWEGRGAIRDLLVDEPGLMDKLRQGIPLDKLPEAPRNFSLALNQLGEFKKVLDQQKTFMGDAPYKEAADAYHSLSVLVHELAYSIHCDSSLAEYYRESGQSSLAIPLYRELYREYDPLNPDYASGYVDGVLETIRHPNANGPAIDKKSIEEARKIALKVVADVNGNPAERDSYWQALIEYLDLSAAVGDTKQIQSSLHFCEINKSTPADDLSMPPQPGDDPRIKRARNVLAATLGESFLQLYGLIQAQPSFRIDTLEVNGKTVTIFTAVGAPKFKAVMDTDASGEDVIKVVAAGTAPAAAPGPAGQAPPAATPAPAAVPRPTPATHPAPANAHP